MEQFKFETMNSKKYKNYYINYKKTIMVKEKYSLFDIADFYRCIYIEKLPNNFTETYYLNKNDMQRLSLLNTVKFFMKKKNISEELYNENSIQQAIKIAKFLINKFMIKGNRYPQLKSDINIDEYTIIGENGETYNLYNDFEYSSVEPEDKIKKIKTAGIKSYNSNNIDLINYYIRELYNTYDTQHFSKFEVAVMNFLFGDVDDKFYFNYFKLSNNNRFNILNDERKFKCGIEKLPEDIYNQKGIKFKFKYKDINILINDVYIYNNFITEVYVKTENGRYKNIKYLEDRNKGTIDLTNYSQFLILANTSRGAYIYESDFGETIVDGYIIEQTGVDVSNFNYLRLKNKKDYFALDYNNIFRDVEISKYYLGDSKQKIYLKEPYGVFEDINITYNEYYVSDEYSKRGVALKEILKNVKTYEIIENLFADDKTINYVIFVDKQDVKLNSILKILTSRINNCGAIYHIPIKIIYDSLLNNKEYIENLELSLTDWELPIEDSNLKELYAKEIDNISLIIANKISKEFNINIADVPRYLYNKYLKNYKLSEMHLNNVAGTYQTEQEFYYDYYEKFLIEFEQYGIKTKKWISEYSLYLLVKDFYPDAVFQYKPSWLGKQSLDIFIPSKNIAIEYQGIQHFKSIEFFEQKISFEQRKKLDDTKKELCFKNNINLIEWLYYEPISEILLFKKIEGSRINNE